MVLHTVIAGTTSPTGSGTEDTLASTAFYPTGDNEVQERSKSLPTWIGFDSLTTEIVQIGAATIKDYFRIGMNTWPTARYIKMNFLKRFDTAAKYGNMIQPGIWFPNPIPLDRDADWDIRVATTTANIDAHVLLHLSYGTKYPYKGGHLVTRALDFAADDAVAPNVGGAETVTDLDPRIQYRVAGIQLMNVEDQNHILTRVTSASNNTSIAAFGGSVTSTTYHPNTITQWFPHDSILVSGVETVTVDSGSIAAQKPSVAIIFEEYGGVGSVGGGAGGAGAISPGGGFGNLIGGLIGGAAGAGFGR